jgi:hypothetical protein
MKEMAKEELVLVDRFFMLNEEKPGVTWLEGDQGIDVSLIPLLKVAIPRYTLSRVFRLLIPQHGRWLRKLH